MAYSIITPTNSFVRFDESSIVQSCEFADIEYCLPVYDEDDIHFQFVIEADSDAEADALCDLSNNMVQLGIVYTCAETFALEFTEKPERFRISGLQVLYNWQNGLPDFTSVVEVGECFKVKVVIDGENEFCTNCFQRIGADCHTSVIEYGNDDNFAGFNYCNSEPVNDSDSVCDPTFISFTGETNLAITYTASLLAQYGNMPSVEVWGYVGTDLVRMPGLEIKLDAYPPTVITIDFGGVLSGVIKIKK